MSLDYALSDDMMIGAKYERAARLAGIWFNAAQGTVNTYDDEISDSYDAFVRSSAFAGRLTVRANVFYTRITNQQLFATLSTTPGDGEILNAQRSHNVGIEIESTWIDGGLNAWLSLGWLHAEFDKIEVGAVDFSGNDFPDAPRWTVSIGFTYTQGNGLFVENDATFRPETHGDLQNHPWVVNEQRTIVSARLGWAFPKINVSRYARNLLDENDLDYHDANPDPRELQEYLPGDPREVGVTV